MACVALSIEFVQNQLVLLLEGFLNLFGVYLLRSTDKGIEFRLRSIAKTWQQGREVENSAFWAATIIWSLLYIWMEWREIKSHIQILLSLSSQGSQWKEECMLACLVLDRGAHISRAFHLRNNYTLNCISEYVAETPLPII